MKNFQAYEIGRLFEYLTGITTAAALPKKGYDLPDLPSLSENLPINRYSVAAVIQAVNHLQELLTDSDLSEAAEAMEELRTSLREMEDYQNKHPSKTTFLQDPFAEKLVTNARKVKQTYLARSSFE